MNGQKIKEIRQAKGITQKQLAEQMGADRSYINRIENGNYIPALKYLERIAKVLECSVKDFF